MDLDKIHIEDLEVYAFHGVNPQEKDMGQKFLISLELFLDLNEAGESDDLSKTINYAELCSKVEEEFKKDKYNLIEKAAQKLGEFILLNYNSVKKVIVEVKKPWAPIGKPLKYASVFIERGWHTAYVALGSNLGVKEDNLLNAIKFIKDNPLCRVLKVSKFYETKPVGYTDQDNFLNGACMIKTILSPKKLLEFLMYIEKMLKRERIIRWGPRTIDLDIIFYDNLIFSDDELVIPHPRMHERIFVLEPLNDIAPYFVHPIYSKTVSDLMNNIRG